LNVIVNEKTVVTKENGGTTTAKSTATLPASPTKIYSARLVMLPDYSQEYIIQWSAGAGSVKPKFTQDETTPVRHPVGVKRVRRFVTIRNR